VDEACQAHGNELESIALHGRYIHVPNQQKAKNGNQHLLSSAASSLLAAWVRRFNRGLASLSLNRSAGRGASALTLHIKAGTD
jgi:hypothetical protein